MKTVVIIPVYNGLVHLKTLLCELSARTPGDDVGFIVVDDASTEDGVSDAL